MAGRLVSLEAWRRLKLDRLRDGDVRLFWAMLDLADAHGRLPADEVWLVRRGQWEADSPPSLDAVRYALERLAAAGLIMIYIAAGKRYSQVIPWRELVGSAEQRRGEPACPKPVDNFGRASGDNCTSENRGRVQLSPSEGKVIPRGDETVEENEILSPGNCGPQMATRARRSTDLDTEQDLYTHPLASSDPASSDLDQPSRARSTGGGAGRSGRVSVPEGNLIGRDPLPGFSRFARLWAERTGVLMPDANVLATCHRRIAEWARLAGQEQSAAEAAAIDAMLRFTQTWSVGIGRSPAVLLRHWDEIQAIMAGAVQPRERQQGAAAVERVVIPPARGGKR